MIPWINGVPISGIPFPMVTASGTYAKNYDAAQLSGVISKDGGAFAALGNRISGISDGFYCIVSLSSTEMTCTTWMIKITSNSGCLDQALLGINASNESIPVAVSGIPGLASNVSSIGLSLSGMALRTDVSALAGTLVAVSGLKGDVSGLPGILTAVSGLWANGSGTDKILVAVSGIKNDVSGMAGILSAVSGVSVDCSGINGVLSAVSGLVNNVSGINGILVAVSGLKNDVSGMRGIMTAVSGLKNDVSGITGLFASVSSVAGGVAAINTADSESLTSGTLAHDARLLRWQSWEKLVIDKRYTPNRLYLKTSAINVSSYFEITDDSNTTERNRAG